MKYAGLEDTAPAAGGAKVKAPTNVPGTADDLARKLMLAKNQVIEARARVKRAVAAVAHATAGAKQAKIEAR